MTDEQRKLLAAFEAFCEQHGTSLPALVQVSYEADLEAARSAEDEDFDEADFRADWFLSLEE